MKPHYLHDLFNPKHIAVIGASNRPHSTGQTVFANLLACGFTGRISPVNLKHPIVGGIPAVSHLSQLSDKVDVALVLTPTSSFDGIIRECAKLKIRFVVIIKNLDEQTPKDKQLLEKALKLAKRLQVRLLGPSILGLMRPPQNLQASTYQGVLNNGSLALITQSSGLSSALLDWAHSRKIGFSTVLSLGVETLDIDYGEILDFLVQDGATKAILLHIHHIIDGRRFMSALRSAARVKPVVVLKSGREINHIDGLSTASSLLDSNEIFNSALSRAGVLRVQTISQLFTAARMLTADYRTQGNRLAIVSNGIGLGILAVDSAHDAKVPLAQLSTDTLKQLKSVLPPHNHISNPIDTGNDASPLRFRSVVKLCLDDANVDGVLVIFSPQPGSDDVGTAQMMLQLQKESSKPLMMAWMGDEKVKNSIPLLTQARAIHFKSPEFAIEVFSSLAEFQQNQALLWQTPKPLEGQALAADIKTAKHLLREAQQQHITVLPEYTSKNLLNQFHILSNQTRLAQNEDEAVALAQDMGYPVVLKIDSPDIFYKSNIGGVKLNIHDAPNLHEAYRNIMERAAVLAPQAHINGITVQPMLQQREAREVMISVTRDQVFGPVITFGAGGLAASIQKDSASSLPPLNNFIIQDMIKRTKVGQTLGEFKNMRPIDTEALEQVLLRVSDMVSELPEIIELEINPLLLSPAGAIAVDARVVIDSHQVKSTRSQRYKHMAIMPYPSYLEEALQLKDGTKVTLRPLRPEDADMVQAFVRNLSDESRYNRFMSSIKQLSQQVLVRFTQLDYDREMALALVYTNENGNEEVLGMSRYVTDPDMEVCEFAISIADKWQGRGVGTILMQKLFDVASQQGLSTMRGEVLTSNSGMLQLMKKLGFKLKKDPEDPNIYIVTRPLSADTAT